VIANRGKKMKNGTQAGFEEVFNELRTANRLRILSLVRSGLAQRDIAATIGVSESVVSEMFPKGLLRRVARMSRDVVPLSRNDS